jgi:cyclophilin family peptidyl-prolyl cis-trans isomerase
MPSEKRARQRAGREARLAAQARSAKRRKNVRNVVIAIVVAAVVVGIVVLVSNNKKKPTSASGTTTTTAKVSAADAKAQAAANALAVNAGCPASTAARVNTQKYAAAPAMSIDPTKTYTATVATTAGTFTIALDAQAAPITVNNFVFLADKGFYHCVIFHRVIPTFMDQTGDPTGTGQGGPGYTIKDEYPPKAANADDQYPIGSVAMANTGQPNTGGSQWFVVAGPQGESLPNTYSLFGTITSGMKVVDTINSQGSAAGVPPDVTQRILSVKITES